MAGINRMTTTIIDIADALVAELNGNAFSRTFTAARAYYPTVELADMSVLHVTVVPKSKSTTPINRISDQEDLAIDIGVQQRFSAGADPIAEADGLMAFVDEIAAFLNRRPLAGLPALAWLGTDNENVYSPEHFAQFRQFTSVLTVTYRQFT